jgi:predicted membrane metal-binding protein
MLRTGELVMVLAPFVALAILYGIAVRRWAISRRVLVLALLTVFAFGGWLTWLGTSQRLDPYQRYVPAMLRNGVVVEGHGE